MCCRADKARDEVVHTCGYQLSAHESPELAQNSAVLFVLAVVYAVAKLDFDRTQQAEDFVAGFSCKRRVRKSSSNFIIELIEFQVLDRMEHTEVFPLDQVCYRILIELCGECGEPSLAVKVLQVGKGALILHQLPFNI